MKNRGVKRIETCASGRRLAEDFSDLSNRILRYANRGVSKIEFVQAIAKMLIDFSGCDAVEFRIGDGNRCYRGELKHRPEESFRFEMIPWAQTDNGKTIPCCPGDSAFEQLCQDISRGHFDPSLPFFTRAGSYWTGDTEIPFSLSRKGDNQTHLRIGGDYPSLALIPFTIDNENIGLLQLKSERLTFFTKDEIEFYEGVAQTIGVAVADWRAQVALRERIKELTCLYGIAKIVEQPGISLEASLKNIVELLPPAWLYPDNAAARITLDEHSCSTPNFRESGQKISDDIVVKGERRGMIEVVYTEEKSELDEGPFLFEERSLIDAVAREVSLLIERREAEQDRIRLQDQLRHADRLATIGQLAAGVAHELNEPLGNILGFAQLAKKCPGLAKPAEQDIDKIVDASLHAREVIRRLMLFTRQKPPQKNQVNLNNLVEEGLYFLSSRCAKAGIELVRELSPDLPEIAADSGQLHQVLVNLVVNAIQAMPEGGTLTIQTRTSDGIVSLIVKDTGIGMSEETMKQIFSPFFTTRPVGEGTGLGLPVVQDIVTSHGGSIRFESNAGRGSRFEVMLPMSGLVEVEVNAYN